MLPPCFPKFRVYSRIRSSTILSNPPLTLTKHHFHPYIKQYNTMENVSPSRDQSMSAEKPPSKPLKYIDVGLPPPPLIVPKPLPLLAEGQTLTCPCPKTQIGINLTDPMYRGIYHGRQAHPEDLPQVISRAQKHGVRKMMVTGSDIEESQKAIELVKQYRKYRTPVSPLPLSGAPFPRAEEGSSKRTTIA